MATTVHRQCTLCEAHCGINVEVEGRTVLRIAGDHDDAMSRGYICPKATALADIYEDPDRLRRPVKRAGDRFVEVGWDEAFELAAGGLRRIIERDGRDAVATYLGNPGAHSSGIVPMIAIRALLRSANNYSALSVDSLPQHRCSHEMFGSLAILPIPDIDRTSYMLMFGANPAVSNGSGMAAPAAGRRLRAICERGGRVVVVDPRRTETAAHASEHVSIRPGGDPYLLLGILHTVFEQDLVALGRLQGHVDGLADLEAVAGPWAPGRAAEHAGVDADTIVRLAREFTAAPRAIAYGRVGVCQQTTGTLTHWLINALNVVTGNLDRPGGMMFPRSPVDAIGALGLLPVASKWSHRRQRVSGLPGFLDEFPVAGLADEILTPGAGQVRALLCHAGNPVLSTPNGKRLDEALAALEHFVAVDMYITETSRHAHVILPPLSQLECNDIDLIVPAISVRNHIRYNPVAVPADPGGRTDWEILWELAGRIGTGRAGRARNALVRALGAVLTPDRLAGLALRAGPYGILRRGPLRSLTVGKIRRSVHGIDLGPLEPRLPGLLRTRGKRVRLAPQAFLAETARLDDIAAEHEAAIADGFDLTLIGRRQLRSNNSWMHNSPRLMKGPDRCTALMHPDDAAARGLTNGDRVRVASAVGAIEVPLQVSDEVRPGVVSVPHGFGHGRPRVGWRRAAANGGASVNDITDPSVLDRLTGNAAYNAVPVRVEAAVPTPTAPEAVGAMG
ncbi:molybdopterin oxidoreductase family protein [Mycobacterium sp.]|uniref:molybdopterin oxidoreductase family protein n=1 Tax=Mycobacterium sp. TaxID=1785 RepID=UPI002BB8179B|nr:molybdopterin oxidoreductase family protein [Mycobacterium sp.]HTY33448.1 molybdopterin oxidoreductase family protein [Mycobacterium sp.]